MNLTELKKMVKEEYNKFLEQDMPDMPDMPQPSAGMEDPTIAVSDNDIDLDGGENPEDTLRAIFDMLKDFFEGDDKPAPKAPKANNKKDDDKGGDKKDDDKKDDDKKDDDKKDDVKESYNRKFRRKISPNKSNDMKILQERFKKLANIIK